MWLGNRCQPPKDVRAALEGLFGQPVGHVKVVQYRIYLRGSGKEFFADSALLLHEYFHVLRQWATGDLTIAKYLAECFRRGYWDNRYEIEAREFTSREIYRYRSLLAQHRTDALPPGVHPIRTRTASGS